MLLKGGNNLDLPLEKIEYEDHDSNDHFKISKWCPPALFPCLWILVSVLSIAWSFKRNCYIVIKLSTGNTHKADNTVEWWHDEQVIEFADLDCLPVERDCKKPLTVR